MKIISATVDKLPNGCFDCGLKIYVGYGMFDKSDKRYYCIASKQRVMSKKELTKRPNFCPLTIKKPKGYFKKYKLKEGCYDEHGGSLPSVESEE